MGCSGVEFVEGTRPILYISPDINRNGKGNNMAIWVALALVALVALTIAVAAQRRAADDPAVDRVRSAVQEVWESVRHVDANGVEQRHKDGDQ